MRPNSQPTRPRFERETAWNVLLGCMWTAFLALVQPALADDAKGTRSAIVIKMEGGIDPLQEQFMLRRLEEAQSLGAKIVIIEIDSPGGFIDCSKVISEKIADIEWAETVAYIPREALSAAAFVALGCDQIVMNPRARMGDAGPIVMGEDSAFRHAPEKIVSDVAQWLRVMAERHGRSPALAEAMVDKDLEVFECKNLETGKIAYMSDLELKDAKPGVWEKGKLVFESQKDRFLEVKGRRAVELGLANATVNDFAELKEYLGLKADPQVLRHTWVDTLVTILNTQFVTVLLLLMGLLFLYIELHMAGFGVFGLLSGLCFILFFWSRILGGGAGWLGIVLFVSGMICLALEFFVIPGFGVTGVTGILLVMAGILVAGQRSLFPQDPYDYDTLMTSVQNLIIACVLLVGCIAVISRYLPSMPVVGKMILQAPTSDGVEEGDLLAPSHSGTPSHSNLVGQQGVTMTPLRPAGKVAIGDLHLDVVAEGSFLAEGQPVKIIEAAGNRVVVRAV